MQKCEWRWFKDRREAERYALETGLPLGRRINAMRKLLEPYFVGKFSPYHYVEVDLKRK